MNECERQLAFIRSRVPGVGGETGPSEANQVATSDSIRAWRGASTPDANQGGSLVAEEKPACLALLALLGALLAGCATARVEGRAVTLPEGAQVVRLTASNYRFEPNVIEGKAGARIRFEVQNAGGTRHNLTVRDPGGTVLGSVDVAANGKAVLELPALAPGRYGLSCDRPFHTALGMDGETLVR